jgi:hypothetical protein
MSSFSKFSNLSYADRELVVFDDRFREILAQLTLIEKRPERLEAVIDLLNSKTMRNSASQTSEYDLAQSILLVVNRIQAKSDD